MEDRLSYHRRPHRIIPPVRVRFRRTAEQRVREDRAKLASQAARVARWEAYFAPGGPGWLAGLRAAKAVWERGKRTEGALYTASVECGWDWEDRENLELELRKLDEEVKGEG